MKHVSRMSDQELREARDAADAQVQRHLQMGDSEMADYWKQQAEQIDNEVKRRAK